MNKGTVFWITGLSGAGKTAIGQLLYQHLRHKKQNLLFLDGDILREMYGNDLGYSADERYLMAMRNARLCRMLSEQGIDVICCTIAMFDEVREWNRCNIAQYCEVYLEVPYEVLYQRDQKGLYSRGEGNQVVGVDVDCQLPKQPDLVLNNDGSRSPEQILQSLLDEIQQAGAVFILRSRVLRFGRLTSRRKPLRP